LVPLRFTFISPLQEECSVVGCFHVVDAANGAATLQKIAFSPVAEGYATAATIAKHGKMPALAAYDSGNLLSVATALHQRYPDKADHHRQR
jgi:putative DNA primase/helicase